MTYIILSAKEALEKTREQSLESVESRIYEAIYDGRTYCIVDKLTGQQISKLKRLGYYVRIDLPTTPLSYTTYYISWAEIQPEQSKSDDNA